MTDMLKDKIQLREFGEFCRYENCVENIVSIINFILLYYFFMLKLLL